MHIVYGDPVVVTLKGLNLIADRVNDIITSPCRCMLVRLSSPALGRVENRLIDVDLMIKFAS